MKTIYLLLILLTVWSCRQRAEERIRIIKVDSEKADSVVLSKIASGVNKIILETTDSSLITSVTEIAATREFLFVNDACRRILQFDSAGKFIRQIGKQGRGPGEYLSAVCFTLDSTNRVLYIDSFKQILSFDFSGNLLNVIGQESVPEYVTIMGKEFLSVSTSPGIKLENDKYVNITSMIKYTLRGDPLDTLIIKRVFLSGQAGTLNPQAFIISDLGNIQYLYYPVLVPEPILRDTVYILDSFKLIPSLKLDFGDAANPKNGRKQIFMRNIFRTNRYLFADYTYSRNQKLFCYDFSQNIKYNLNHGFNDDYYMTGKILLKPLNLLNGKLYFVKEAFEVAGKIEGVTENSNPIIFFVHLK